MESKKILLLDMDNTLFDFTAGLGRTSTLEPKYNPPEMYRPGFFKNLKPTPGAVEAVKRLIESDKYDIYICSKPVAVLPDSYSDKVESIITHFPELSDKIILTQNKFLIKADIIIDDDGQWLDVAPLAFHFDRRESLKHWSEILMSLVDTDYNQLHWLKGVQYNGRPQWVCGRYRVIKTDGRHGCNYFLYKNGEPLERGLYSYNCFEKARRDYYGE